MIKVKGWGIKALQSPFEEMSYETELQPHEVAIQVTHCGICHSDILLADGDLPNKFPQIPGHEVVGTVAAIGSAVANFTVGQRVGLGWQCDSCGTCEYCLKGQETFCKRQKATCVGHHGGLADYVVANDRFVFAIPSSLDSAETAPLFCAGITVYTPIAQYAKPGDHAAIVGIGGLGHLGIQVARAYKCEVTAISTSPKKEEMARELGASHFLTKPALDAYDVILNTSNMLLDMKSYLNALRPGGTFVQLGISKELSTFHLGALSSRNKKVVGSGTGTPKDIRDLLILAEMHSIQSRVNVLPMNVENITYAFGELRNGKPDHRIILQR